LQPFPGQINEGSLSKRPWLVVNGGISIAAEVKDVLLIP
jgi:hypothetical protein